MPAQTKSMNYGEPLYWESRYAIEQSNSSEGLQNFDFYVKFEFVFNILISIIDIKKPHKVLVIGIGRSNILDVLYKHGFRDITAIDISPLIVAQMQSKYSDYTGIDCKCMF